MLLFVRPDHRSEVVFLFVSVELNKRFNQLYWLVFWFNLHRVVVLQRYSHSRVSHVMVSIPRNSIVAHFFHV